MLWKIVKLQLYLKEKLNYQLRRRYLKYRKVIIYSPYNVEIYKQLLSNIIETRGISSTSYLSMEKTTNKINIFLRHDIDTSKCINNISALLDVDKSFNIKSGVYFRVDDKEYSLSRYKGIIQSCQEDGFEIGLHSVCYLKNDYIREFGRETKKFADEVGCQPRSFTVHGFGNHRLDVRMRFVEEIVRRLPEFGYKFTDCHPAFRSYDYVIEDCHWDENRKARFIYDDFIKLPPFFEKGKNYLILTHPCYWKKA